MELHDTLTGMPAAIEILIAFGFVAVFFLYCVIDQPKDR
jgi:Ni/Fe-hydrogenase subunit HybB-like protein